MMSMHPGAPVLMGESPDTAEVDRLLSQLQDNLEEAKLSLKRWVMLPLLVVSPLIALRSEQEDLLDQIKVQSRDFATCAVICDEKGISTLSKYGFDNGSTSASREALRSLANAFLLHEHSRQIFVDLGFAPKAADRLKLDDLDDEFLVSRLLFLLTYNTRVDFSDLVKSHELAESIIGHISRHGKACSKHSQGLPPGHDIAMTETLKLIFNVTYYSPDLIPDFTPAVEPLISILLHHPTSHSSLQPPITYVVNALLNLDLRSAGKKTPLGREASTSPLFPYSDPDSVIGCLSNIFDRAIREQPERELDRAAAPLCTLLRKIYEIADSRVQSRMRWLMLPREADREKPLGQGDTFAARLLQMSVSPKLPTLRENISNLLFELSDKDAESFVRNIGYGYASGFLMSHGIPLPGSAHGGRGRAGDTVGGANINPVTGQKMSAEERKRPALEEMTDEEKEREAERLFVLFERLKATGVVDVKNPVQQAVDEGRFEELD